MKEILQKSANYDDRGHLDPESFNRNIRFYTYAPPEDLARVLEHFWIIEWDKDGIYHSEKNIRENEQPDWVGIAYDVGYSSQQHFISDFKKVLGKTPRQYKRATSPI